MKVAPRPGQFYLLVTALLFSAAVVAPGQEAKTTAGPRGIYPYLFKRLAGEQTTATGGAGRGDWGLLAHRHTTTPQRLHIIAFMVEFNRGNPDTTDQTTGNGLFDQSRGGTRKDSEEYAVYQADTVYRYDRLPHDQHYFRNQFAFVRDYYRRVSFGKLDLSFELHPPASGAFHVDSTMVFYSPGGKKRMETWDSFYYRKTRGLIHFVKDAVKAARGGQGHGSPFSGVYRTANGQLVSRDSTGAEVPTAFMILHAGASYLTDGGTSGYFGQDSPSDMIDAFVYDDFFAYFRDTLSFDTLNGHTGVQINDSLLLNEFMMVSRTSNQDGLNWGIHGIMVNQIARQLGIPDLYSTSSGISGIGAFCIMDFAGYSAGQGFIPPWPSAWVRAWMGWDTPVVVAAGMHEGTFTLTAIGDADSLGTDTTILLVPINDHEYYLIENRQRNSASDPALFNYDTTGTLGAHIASYPYNVNIPANVTDSSGRRNSNTILGVRNYDVGLPASGVLVWHVDEEVVRGRLRNNMVNADSLYRGVSLVEADGINDLGVMFQDAFYQAAFDYGGAEDVFPHTAHTTPARTVSLLGPRTRPSTRSNDGGHSWLTISIDKGGNLARHPAEKSLIRGEYLVSNYASSRFSITIERDYLHPGWPRRIVPDSVFEPAVLDMTGNGNLEIALLDHSGRLYLYDGRTGEPAVNLNAAFALRTLMGDTLYHEAGDTVITGGDTAVVSVRTPVTDTVGYFARIASPAAMPTAVGSRLFIPSTQGFVHVVGTNGSLDAATHDTIPGPGAGLTTVICNFSAEQWAVGTARGVVLFGNGTDTTGSSRLPTTSAVTALAALHAGGASIAAIQRDGTLSLVTSGRDTADASTLIKGGLPPFTLATGDLDRSGTPEIVVVDSRQGIWVVDATLEVSAGWDVLPNTWPSSFTWMEEANRATYDRLSASDDPHAVARARRLLPYNPSPPALADIDGDGHLDILVGGTNGIYAFNYKGVLLYEWPAYLDNRFWFQRGSITTSPIVGRSNEDAPLVLFSSPTGDKATFRVTSIDSTGSDATKVYFTRLDGTRDSLFDLSSDLVDSMLLFNEGLIAPWVLPGGYIDALTPRASRPIATTLTLPSTGREPFSYWPLTAGRSMGSAPLLCDIANNGRADLIAVAQSGWIYRWEFDASILRHDPQEWAQSGFNSSRTFAWGSALPNAHQEDGPAIELYQYPNPTGASNKVVFRYRFAAPATGIRLDIFTYTGHHIYTWRPDDSAAPTYPGWNEHTVTIRDLGPSVYRCRLGATVKGEKVSSWWKMAVTR